MRTSALRQTSASIRNIALLVSFAIGGGVGAFIDHGISQEHNNVSSEQVEKMIADSQLKEHEAEDHRELDELKSQFYDGLEMQHRINEELHSAVPRNAPTTQNCNVERYDR
jgi:hypothetical protein